MTTFITKTLFNIKSSISKHLHTSLRFASESTKYKAAVLKSKDAKELVIDELKRPKLQAHQVRIQVSYCSVNILDISSLSACSLKLPFVPGFELSGEVIEVGKTAAKLFKKDDRVVALSFHDFGGLAAECVVDCKDVWTTPSAINLQDSAVIPYAYSLALYTFGVLSPTKESNTIVVSVGPAGIGLAAVDVAANIYKAKVIAVTDTDKNSQLTREKGAFATMHYNDNVQKNVISALSDKKADIVFDAVSGDLHDAVAACVSSCGKIFTPIMGKVNVPPPHASLTGISLCHLRQADLNTYRQVVQDTLEMVEQGLITPNIISEKFDFHNVNKAIEFIKSKQCTGKVVVKVD